MVVYEEQNSILVKMGEPVLNDDFHQVIISTLNKPSLVAWLKREELPEPFFEDIASFEQTPGFEDFSEGSVLIVKYLKLERDEFLEFYEENVALIDIGNKLAVICKDEATAFDLELKFDKRMRGKKANAHYEMYTFLDILTDQQIQLVDGVNGKLELLEESIMSERLDRQDSLKNLYFARRSLNRLTHIFVNESVAVGKFYTGITNSIKKKFRFEFMDLKEHKQNLVTESRSLQDKTVGLLNLQIGLASNRANDAMTKLAGISLIFLPITYIASNYGQNFKYLPELDYKWAYFIEQGVNVVIVVGIVIWLKKKKWL